MWIEVEIPLVNKKLIEMNLESDDLWVPFMLNLDKVDGYRIAVSDNDDELDDEIIVYMSSGEEFAIRYSYEDLKQLLKDANKVI